MNNAVDFFKNAILNEVMAGAFYAQAAEATQNDASRMLFLDLSGREEDHARQLIERLGQVMTEPGFDAGAFLKELEADAEGTLGAEANQVILQGEPKAVLEWAMSLEEKARDNYRKLSDELIDPVTKAYCLAMAEEEEQHRSQIEKELNSLDMAPSERPGL